MWLKRLLSAVRTRKLLSVCPDSRLPACSPRRVRCASTAGWHVGVEGEPAGSAGTGIAVALGSNLGDREANLRAGLQLLQESGIQVLRHSRLYESAPAYVTDQPRFLNAAVAARTQQEPLQLLDSLKRVEAVVGRREDGQRWGPRPLDLDLIFYEDAALHLPLPASAAPAPATAPTSPSPASSGAAPATARELTVPHPRWHERSFVKAPLADLAPGEGDDYLGESHAGLARMLRSAQATWAYEGGEDMLKPGELEAVLPLGRLGVRPWRGRTWVMGILNVTPDSFSDGGRLQGVEQAVAAARRMVAEGADVIDVGGQSTRPGADWLPAEQELQRVLPVIRALAQDEAFRETAISIDTFHAKVAREAVNAGAHMVNDVSGGRLDANMYKQVAELGVPYVLMHMRGTPATMQQAPHISYEDVCAEVGAELQQAAEAAMAAGIEPWRIVLDPGLGFAKTKMGNLALLGGLAAVRCKLRGPLARQPLLLGPSRKGFLGAVTGVKSAEDRDVATAAAAALCVANGANIVRAHNVDAVRQAVRLADAVAAAMEASRLGLSQPRH